MRLRTILFFVRAISQLGRAIRERDLRIKALIEEVKTLEAMVLSHDGRDPTGRRPTV